MTKLLFNFCVIAIDTSGSVSDEAIGQALEEIKAVIDEATNIDGYVVCLDAKTYEPIPISKFDINNFDARGGGGQALMLSLIIFQNIQRK